MTLKVKRKKAVITKIQCHLMNKNSNKVNNKRSLYNNSNHKSIIKSSKGRRMIFSKIFFLKLKRIKDENKK